MSKIDTVQIGSFLFRPSPLFNGFQTLGNTTNFTAFTSTTAKPVQVLGSGGVNPIGVFDNFRLRASTLLIGFMATNANNVNVAFDITGFSKIENATLYTSPFYWSTKFFTGQTQAAAIDVSTTTGEPTAFMCSSFNSKTAITPYINYIEPSDASSGALLIMDIRGMDHVAIRLAQGTTAATKAQVIIGVN